LKKVCDKMKITILHFFPKHLNLYGDNGNIRTLVQRLKWRGIDVEVKAVEQVDGLDIKEGDIFFIGGGPDSLQSLCTDQLFKIKDEFKSAIEDGVPALTICGGYQFLGTHYITADKQELKGLGILDFYNESKGDSDRLIGNMLIESPTFGKIVGFENHGGRTYHGYDTLGDVVVGFGNNDEDKKEGLVYKNLIGTYLHGPILPKNPTVADFLIGAALERKYGLKELTPLNDTLEEKTKQQVWTLFNK